jgi:hypothetical protein
MEPDQIARGDMRGSVPVADEIDDLHDVVPEDFVAARDALAKELKAAGKVAQAADVKKLRKPTVQAWIARTVQREHDDVVDALRHATAAVADAQEKAITSGDRDALRDATATRRDALRDVGRAVEQVLARNGRPAAHKDEVLAAIEAAVTSEVAGGTFGTRDDLVIPDREPERDVEAERRAAEQAEKDRQKALAEIDKAEAKVERARAALEDAEADLSAVMERHAGVDRDA